MYTFHQTSLLTAYIQSCTPNLLVVIRRCENYILQEPVCFHSFFLFVDFGAHELSHRTIIETKCCFCTCCKVIFGLCLQLPEWSTSIFTCDHKYKFNLIMIKGICMSRSIIDNNTCSIWSGESTVLT